MPTPHALSKIALTALLSLGLLSAAAETPSSPGPLPTIAALDVPRYMGTWFEIARYPNWFQKKCTGHTKADYSQQPDGTVQVINRCQLAGGGMSEAIGTGRQVGPVTSPKLQVRFAPEWLSWLPFVWGDYWIIDLDDPYQLVAVSEPSRAYLWILSRTPQVDPKAYSALVERLTRIGFDASKLERTAQD